jgi:hypothetical protein
MGVVTATIIILLLSTFALTNTSCFSVSNKISNHVLLNNLIDK